MGGEAEVRNFSGHDSIFAPGIKERVSRHLEELNIAAKIQLKKIRNEAAKLAEVLQVSLFKNVEIKLVGSSEEADHFKILVTIGDADFFAPCTVYNNDPLEAENQFLNRIQLVKKKVIW